MQYRFETLQIQACANPGLKCQMVPAMLVEMFVRVDGGMHG